MNKWFLLVASGFALCAGGAGQSNSDLPAASALSSAQKHGLAAGAVGSNRSGFFVGATTMFRDSASSKIPLPPPT
jgi:hypothetical protein